MDLCVARLISESSTRQTTKAARVSCLEAVTDLLAKEKTYRTINSLVIPSISPGGGMGREQVVFK